MFEEALKTWHEKQKIVSPLGGGYQGDTLSDSEMVILQSFIDATHSVITWWVTSRVAINFCSLLQKTIDWIFHINLWIIYNACVCRDMTSYSILAL